MVVILHIGNGDRPTPEEDGGKGSNSADSQNSLRINLDWREVRANLFAREQVMYFFSFLKALLLLKQNFD